MRVLVISDCYFPSTKSVAQLIHDLAHELSRRGHEVTVMAPTDSTEAPAGIRSQGGIEVVRYRAGRTKGVGLVRRALSEMALSLVAWWRTRKYLQDVEFDYIVFYSPSIFFGPLVHRLKRRWGAPSYLVLRDIFPDWAVDTGVMKKGGVYWVFKLFERLQYEVADVIGVETSGSLEHFRGGPYEQKTELLRNWTTTVAPPPPDRSLRKELALDHAIIFVYGGNIGVAQDMDNLLRLAGGMAGCSEAHFLIVGEGSERQRVEEQVERAGMENVTTLGAVDPQRYLSILGAADVGVITLDRRLKTFSTTGKLLGYLQCGLPVLASYNPGNDLEHLLRDSGAGLASVNGDDRQFLANACLLCDCEIRRRMAENAKRLLREHFAVETIAEQLLSHPLRATRSA